MARIGANPARGKTTSYRPAPVTLALLTYIPDLSGYFEDRLQILKLVLASLRAHTTGHYDLIVFDNHSCDPVVAYLQEQRQFGNIDYLMLAGRNIGKIGALRMLFEAAPGETIAYSDDDILFYPGWLEAQLDILRTFPKVGMVSGAPVRDAAHHAHRSLDALVEAGSGGLTIATERRIPDEWETDWAVSTGRDPKQHLEQTRHQLDTVLRKKPEQGDAIEAIGSANHFQFISPKQVILAALPDEWTGKLMGHMVELDEAVDGLGYLRLSTTERYTRHLGNRLSPEIWNDAISMGLVVRKDAEGYMISERRGASQEAKRHWSFGIPGIRRIYMALYQHLFDLLYR